MDELNKQICSLLKVRCDKHTLRLTDRQSKVLRDAQKSKSLESSGVNGLNIRTNESPKWDKVTPHEHNMPKICT